MNSKLHHNIKQKNELQNLSNQCPGHPSGAENQLGEGFGH